MTVDPHLHRIKTLGEIYTMPTRVVHAAPRIGAWIGVHIEHPVLIGPDSESSQWVAAAAVAAKAPHIILGKRRTGDRSVKIAWPESVSADRTPVVVDDIASSGETLLAAAAGLAARGFANPICVLTHALFDAEADARLKRAFARIVSTDTVPHASNAIDVAQLLIFD